MTTENEALPSTEPVAASPIDETIIDKGVVEPAEGEPKTETKAEKTPEQREIDRLRRGIDRRTRQLSDARAQLNLTRGDNPSNYQESKDDSEPLSLTRAQIQEMVTAEAQKLAPTLREQASEAERRQSVVQSLAKTWGQERFDEVSSDLDDVFGGLTDRSGRPKPAIEAVFESDSPASVIEWLTDPDNADEAERISAMNAVQAGRAIAKLEAKLGEEAAKAKPKPSKVPAPLDPVKGGGPANKALAHLSGDDFDARRREQIKNR